MVRGRRRSRTFTFNDFRPLLVIVVCGIIGIVLTMMLNLAVTNEVLTMSDENVERFSTLIILMSLALGAIIGVAGSSRR